MMEKDLCKYCQLTQKPTHYSTSGYIEIVWLVHGIPAVILIVEWVAVGDRGAESLEVTYDPS